MASGDLFKSGRPIRLQDQPRQVLLALLQQPGAIVSRDQLRLRLWADDTFVDVDNGLNVAIRKVRDALGDSGPTARYVETVRGRGYRFIAPVSAASTGPTDAPNAPDLVDVTTPPTTLAPTSPPSSAASPRRWTTAVAAGALMLCVVALAFALRAGNSPAPIESLVVLPLSNLVGDDSAQYLVDGLTDSLTSALARQSRLRVLASASAARTGATLNDPADAARQLHVDAVVAGSVTRSTTGVIVTVSLLEAATNRPLWSGRFDRTGVDSLTASDDIVDAVLVNVSRHSASAGVTPARGRLVLPEARAAYLRGRFFWARRGQDNAVKATGYLTTAIQLQRDYAEAWAGLADVYAVHTGAPSAAIEPWPGDSVEAGVIAAREALRLDPTLGEAHAALGKLLANQRRWSEAEKELRLAVELSPQYSTARQWLGTMYLRLRRCDEALVQVDAGARLDPLTALVNEAVGSVYLGCGEPERAVRVLEEVLAMHPASTSTSAQLARALLAAGRPERAIALLEPLVQPGDETFAKGTLLLAYSRAGRTRQLATMMATVRSPYLRAVVAAANGNKTEMLAHLDVALDSDRGWLHSLLGELAFQPYTGDQEFVAFARRAGFPVPPIPPGRFGPVSAGLLTSR